jgi:protein SCO1/2
VTRTVRRTAAALLLAFTLSACGGEERELAGYRRDPAPEVGGLSLPDLSDGGADFAFRADPDHLLIVYFGYTNCPDFCPTTLSDLRLATRRMDEDDAARIDVAMVTIDPERDLAVLDEYVASFFEHGHALGTDDDDRLRAAAAPFGVGYSVERDADGEVTDVSHSTALYAVDDEGELTLTWQFGVPIDDLAADLSQLLDEEDAEA